jgi:hypothetical protein
MMGQLAGVRTRDDMKVQADNLRNVLTILCNDVYTSSDRWLNAVTISHVLRDDYGVYIHWRTIDAVLFSRRNLVWRKKNQGRWLYKVLQAGRDCLGTPDSSIVIVEPTEAVRAVASLHDSLANLSGRVSICDPYVDDVTVEHLDSCPRGGTVRLLTQMVRDSGKLRRLLAAARISGHDFEIRALPGATLHDRYIIDDKSMLILGTSLNGFGKKQCFIIRAGDDVRHTMLATFDTNWNTATPWP